MCWLAMPLGAGILRWVLAFRTIEKNRKSSLNPPPPPLKTSLFAAPEQAGFILRLNHKKLETRANRHTAFCARGIGHQG